MILTVGLSISRSYFVKDIATRIKQESGVDVVYRTLNQPSRLASSMVRFFNGGVRGLAEEYRQLLCGDVDIYCSCSEWPPRRSLLGFRCFIFVANSEGYGVSGCMARRRRWARGDGMRRNPQIGRSEIASVVACTE